MTMVYYVKLMIQHSGIKPQYIQEVDECLGGENCVKVDSVFTLNRKDTKISDRASDMNLKFSRSLQLNWLLGFKSKIG